MIRHPLTERDIVGKKNCVITITSKAYFETSYKVICDARYTRNIWFDIKEEI